MDISLPAYIAEELKQPFQRLLSNKNFGDSVNGICELISLGKLSRQNVLDILEQHNIKSLQHIKSPIFDLLLSYINHVLDDNFITVKEAECIKYLKLFLKIKEGDFYHFRYYEIENILNRQFEKMYADNKINIEESLQRVALQQLFDLSYDQFLELSTNAVTASIARGANPLDLDAFIKLK